jgi:hypothetical protein
MPAKLKKFNGGRTVAIKSIHLANGNLLVPQRDPRDRSEVVWVEVTPDSSLYKRWLPVGVNEPDPRT